MATKIDIIADSLIQLGVSPISDINDGSDVANVMKVTYPNFKRHLLSVYPWNFTKKRVQLARSTSAPLFGWKYAYQLPSDILTILAAYPSDSVGREVFLEWDRQYDKIVTDSEEVWLYYQVEVPDQDLPAYFLEFISTALADKVCMTLTDNSNLKALMNQQAYGTAGDNLIGGLCGQARRIDAQQVPVKVSNYSSLISSREDF